MKEENRNKTMALIKIGIILLFISQYYSSQAQMIYKMPHRPYGAVVVDYDLDGDNDLIIGSSDPGFQDPDSIVIMFNDGWGNFDMQGFEANSGVFIYCEDLTNDGYPDIISRDGDSIFIHENDQAGGLGNEYAICHTLGNRRIGGIADMDTNGFKDIVYYGIANPTGWGITYNQGNYQFIDNFLYPSTSGSTVRVCTGDLNQDSIFDILSTSNISSEGVSVFYNNISDFEENSIINENWLEGFIADLDADGINDLGLIKYSSFSSTKIRLYKNGLHSFIEKGISYLLSGSDVDCVEDFDLDGYPDLGCANHGDESTPYPQEALIFLNTTDWDYELHHEHHIGEWFFPKLFSGDLNMDGYPDIVAVGYLNPTDDHIQILWNDRNGGFIDTNNVYVFQNEHHLKHHVQIYPNPSSGSISIHSDSEKIKALKIVDFRGTTLLHRDFSTAQNKIELDLGKPNIQAGIYICVVELENGGMVFEKVVLNCCD